MEDVDATSFSHTMDRNTAINLQHRENNYTIDSVLSS